MINPLRVLLSLMILIPGLAQAAWVEVNDSPTEMKATLTFCKDEDMKYDYVQTQGQSPGGRSLSGPLYYFSAVPNFVETNDLAKTFPSLNLEVGREFLIEMKADEFTSQPSYTNMGINLQIVSHQKMIRDFSWTENAVVLVISKTAVEFKKTWAAGCL